MKGSIYNSFRLYKGAWIFNNPPHMCRVISKSDCCCLMKRGGFFIRNIYDFDIDEQTSFWYVIKDSFSGFDELKSKVRTMIRKAQKIYDYKIVPLEYIFDNGLQIFNLALSSYNTKAGLLTKEQMKDKIIKETSNGETECWCVFEKESGKIVALAVNTRYADCCEYNMLKADPYYLHNNTYPYYGLIYEMNRYYLDELGLQYVNDGSRTITEHSNIQSFLIKTFNFRRAYCRLQIYYRWWLKIIINILYPFRNVIPIMSVRAILNLESMRKSCASSKPKCKIYVPIEYF